MEPKQDNTARRIVIRQPDSAQKKKEPSEKPLSKERFKSELAYQTTASLVRTIYRRKLITTNEMLRFLGALVKLLRPLFGSLSYDVEKARHRKSP